MVYNKATGPIICMLLGVLGVLTYAGAINGSVNNVVSALLILVGAILAVKSPARLAHLSDFYLWLVFVSSLGWIEDMSRPLARLMGMNPLPAYGLASGVHLLLIAAALGVLGAWRIRREPEGSSNPPLRWAAGPLTLIGRDLNIHIEGEHEYTLLRGAVDSVYGSVFIEYKNPANSGTRLGPKLSSPGTRKVIEQIDRRFDDVALKTGRTGAAMLGIGCDGRYFVFRRFVSARITAEEPVEVSRWSARRFLWAIFNLGERGLALTPEFLAEDFGSDSQRGQQGISALAAALAEHESEPRVKTFFRQWKTLFGEVCGYDMENPRGHLRTLSDKYGRRGDDPISVLFALHTYYALFMKLLAAHVVSYFQTIGASPLGEMDRAPSSDALRDRLRQLEDGDVYAHLGVTNFLEGDLFSWYLSAWTDEIEKAVRSIAARVLQYSPSSLRDNPAQARDLLKKLYQELVPPPGAPRSG